MKVQSRIDQACFTEINRFSQKQTSSDTFLTYLVCRSKSNATSCCIFDFYYYPSLFSVGFQAQNVQSILVPDPLLTCRLICFVRKLHSRLSTRVNWRIWSCFLAGVVMARMMRGLCFMALQRYAHEFTTVNIKYAVTSFLAVLLLTLNMLLY